jgi:hypothetical protein
MLFIVWVPRTYLIAAGFFPYYLYRLYFSLPASEKGFDIAINTTCKFSKRITLIPGIKNKTAK